MKLRNGVHHKLQKYTVSGYSSVTSDIKAHEILVPSSIRDQQYQVDLLFKLSK
uniref:Uncharacterized protein n=1 Tax=Arion vulgaris TaxID=1028688 RepID=A0A0B7B9U9_9EUPU